jgi:FkbM family methyltransferase
MDHPSSRPSYHAMFSSRGVRELMLHKFLRRPLLRLTGRTGTTVRTYVNGMPHPVYMRDGGTDHSVLYEIFGMGEYERVRALGDLRTIVDCGANVGYAAMYLLNHYPQADIVCVEPDAANLALCRRNLEPYGRRVHFVEAGVWSREAGLIIESDGSGDWGLRVREARAGEKAHVGAVDIPSLIDRTGWTQIDLLKIDIEGSEIEVFGERAQAWLPKVRNLVIELHGDACRDTVLRALAPYDFQRSEQGAVLCCLGLQAATPTRI